MARVWDIANSGTTSEKSWQALTASAAAHSCARCCCGRPQAGRNYSFRLVQRIKLFSEDLKRRAGWGTRQRGCRERVFARLRRHTPSPHSLHLVFAHIRHAHSSSVDLHPIPSCIHDALRTLCQQGQCESISIIGMRLACVDAPTYSSRNAFIYRFLA